MMHLCDKVHGGQCAQLHQQVGRLMSARGPGSWLQPPGPLPPLQQQPARPCCLPARRPPDIPLPPGTTNLVLPITVTATAAALCCSPLLRLTLHGFGAPRLHLPLVPAALGAVFLVLLDAPCVAVRAQVGENGEKALQGEVVGALELSLFGSLHLAITVHVGVAPSDPASACAHVKHLVVQGGLVVGGDVGCHQQHLGHL
mmetsp:Transcript_32762/g.72369  ORF Transcript_32762/g.72369 Transcript_32762/m.72369 type:complete len:200 (-) Transcript_32762:973-1572(-)